MMGDVGEEQSQLLFAGVEAWGDTWTGIFHFGSVWSLKRG